MDKHDRLPFKVGQLAEAKSFLQGYRGAWFRCKIKQIKWRADHLSYLLEYYDFPDEKEKWTRVYQSAFPQKRGIGAKKHLMVRPEYPSLYQPIQIPAVGSISEVIVVADGTWRVGDLVDWRKDDCYWCGKITRIIGAGKAEVVLPPPPMGEGSSYEVPFEDLRPSLEWSPENGWLVPTSTDAGNSSQCARLIRPVNQASKGHVVPPMPILGKRAADNQAAYISSSAPNHAMRSLTASDESASVKAEMKKEPSGQTVTLEPKMNSVPDKNGTAEAILSDSNSGSRGGDGIADDAAQTNEMRLSGSVFMAKNSRNNGGIPLNSLHSDTLEAAIVDLEELANKIRWLKALLKATDASSNSVGSTWKFIEHRPSSTPG